MKPSHPLRSSLFLVLVLAFSSMLVVACTDDVTEDYIDGFNAAGEQLQGVGDRIVAVDDIEGYQAALNELETAVDAYDDLTPPEEVAADHEELVSALRDAVEAARRITEDSSPAVDAQALQDIDSAFDRAGAAEDEIARKLEE